MAALAALLAACAGRAPATAYLPPTGFPVLPITPTLALATVTELPDLTPQPSATPDCRPGLTYLEDLSLPDGTLVSPGERLDKRWRVENSGSCNWDAGYSLALLSGPDLGAAPEQALFPARSGSQVELRILFTAPQEPGTYRSAWQARDPHGQPFGDEVFIEVVVQ
jgi:hypothetical protein